MRLDDAIKRAEKKKTKVKVKRSKPTIATEDRPYLNDLAIAKTTEKRKPSETVSAKREIPRSEKVIRDLLWRMAQDSYEIARHHVNVRLQRLNEVVKKVQPLVAKRLGGK